MALSLPESRSESQRRESAKPSKWPDWHHQTCVCIASGPSLTEEQLVMVHSYRKHGAMTLRAIAINDCGLRRCLPLAAPWADILYAADQRWWQFYKPAFTGLRISGEEVKDVETTPLTMLARGEPMPREPGSVVSGDHSGFQALGLALTLGATRIILLGYDCGGNKRNCHPNREPRFSSEPPFDQWAAKYNQVSGRWPHVEIINCSPQSRISAFRKTEIREVL